MAAAGEVLIRARNTEWDTAPVKSVLFRIAWTALKPDTIILN